MKNEKTQTIFDRLLEFQKICPDIKMDASAQITAQRSYKYATLGGILSAIRKPLTECGLVISQSIQIDKLITQIISIEGDKIESTYPIPQGLSSQQLGMAITYGRRYSISALLSLFAEEDLDAPEEKVKQTTQQQPQQKTEKQQITNWLSEENYNKLLEMFKSDVKDELQKACTLYEKYCTAPNGMKKEYSQNLRPYYNEIKLHV